MCNAIEIAAKSKPTPTMGQIQRAMHFFVTNKIDPYDRHMFDTGHYSAQGAGISTLNAHGNLTGPSIVSIGCGTMVNEARMLMNLVDRILNPDQNAPRIFLAGVDATESALMAGQARMLRRICKLDCRNEQERGERLFVVGINKKGEYVQYGQFDMRRDTQDVFTPSIFICRPNEKGELINNRRVRVLAQIELVLQDILELPDASKRLLSGAEDYFISYCFHWFPDKIGVVKMLEQLMQSNPNSRMLSMEEWKLLVSELTAIPGAKISPETLKEFYRQLAAYVSEATSPIPVAGEPFVQVPGSAPVGNYLTGELRRMIEENSSLTLVPIAEGIPNLATPLGTTHINYTGKYRIMPPATAEVQFFGSCPLTRAP